MAVVKHGNRYVTQEGNRRLAALNLLTNPALADSLETTKIYSGGVGWAPLEVTLDSRSLE